MVSGTLLCDSEFIVLLKHYNYLMINMTSNISCKPHKAFIICSSNFTAIIVSRKLIATDLY